MIRVIVMGTDPESRLGGVSVALRGYLSALKKAGLDFKMIPTHRLGMRGGKFRLWLKAIPLVVTEIRGAARQGIIPIVYCHAGAAPSLMRKFILLIICKCIGAKTVLQIHAIEVEQYLDRWWTRSLFKGGILSVDLLCALTPWWKEKLIARGISIPIAVIPNPMPDEWQIRVSSDAEERFGVGLRICSISRLEEGKGIGHLIEAMKYLPTDVQLSIAGTGSQMELLRTRVNELNLHQQVHFVGWLDDNEKQKLMRNSDIFCLPSSYDSFGMAFVEAMASGLPIVALDNGPIADVVLDGRTGILVGQSNPEHIAAAIKLLMDTQKRSDMAAECRRWVQAQFCSETVGAQLRQAFEALEAK